MELFNEMFVYSEPTTVLTKKEEEPLAGMKEDTVKKREEEEEEEEEEHLYLSGNHGQCHCLPLYFKFVKSQALCVRGIDRDPRNINFTSCYERKQISLKYQTRSYELDKIVTNPEGLVPENNKTVPNTSYENAEAALAIKCSNSHNTTETDNIESETERKISIQTRNR